MAPELSKEHTASTKSDVYSFGVILLETVGLMCATSAKGCPKDHQDWAKRMEKSELRDLFDSNQVIDDSQRMLATRCVLVGLLCSLPDDPASRPSMQTVLDMLSDSHMGEKESTRVASTSSSPSLQDERTSAYDKEWRYEVLTEEKLYDRQEKAKAEVCELLSIPMGVAEVLLRHCHWTPQRVQEGWFDENGEAFRNAVGLPSSPGDISGPKVSRHSSEFICRTCSEGDSLPEDYFGRTMRSAGCSHFYCDQCWHHYILKAVDAGQDYCLCLRCPEYPSCQVPITRELVNMVANDIANTYDWYALRSYVDDSGGRIKWCKGPGCSRAIEFLGDGTDSADVLCDCGHYCCWRCGQEPHWPVSCAMASARLDKERSGHSVDDSRYLHHYGLWEANQRSLQNALEDMDELKHSWLRNMADELGIRPIDLNFLTEAYEVIADCWRVLRWVHAYAYFMDPERDLQKQATESLKRLHVFAEEERVKLCAAEVEAVTEMYSTFKIKLMDLTRKTQQEFETLVEGVQTEFKD